MQRDDVLKRFLRTLLLRPYGANLLQPSAAVWIMFMAVLAFSMAIVEGTVWGFVSWMMLEDSFQVLGILIGLLIACFIWIFDASLITLDLSEDSRGELASEQRRLPKKLLLGVSVRVLVVAGSLLITAPLLGQLFLEAEIISRIQTHNHAEIAQVTAERRAAYEADLNALTAQRDALHAKLQAEISGIGGSGKYGRGPAAIAIEHYIAQVQADLDALNQKAGEELQRIPGLQLSDISKMYDATFLADNFEIRNRIHQELKQESGGIPKSELLAMVFLALIFVVMAVLKIFQSRSVYIYYSDRLQEHYRTYLTGAYNEYIRKREWPGARATMNAYRFQEWLQDSEVLHGDGLRHDAQQPQKTSSVQQSAPAIQQTKAQAWKQKSASAAIAAEQQARVQVEQQDMEKRAAPAHTPMAQAMEVSSSAAPAYANATQPKNAVTQASSLDAKQKQTQASPMLEAFKSIQHMFGVSKVDKKKAMLAEREEAASNAMSAFTSKAVKSEKMNTASASFMAAIAAGPDIKNQRQIVVMLESQLETLKKQYQQQALAQKEQAMRLKRLIGNLDDLAQEANDIQSERARSPEHLEHLLQWKAREMELVKEKQSIEKVLSSTTMDAANLEREIRTLSSKLLKAQNVLDEISTDA